MHTPGPWQVENNRRGDVIVACDSVGTIATLWQAQPADTLEADARLIAAAPDLLDALKSFPGFTDDASVGDPWIERMRAAIAKAEGKS